MTSPFLTNYRIPEIPVHRFCHLLEGIYSVLERKYLSQTVDPLYEIVVRNHRKMSHDEYTQEENAYQNHEGLADAIAGFHYDLAGCFSGWSRRGRYSDIISDDGTKLVVWKNKFVVQRPGQELLDCIIQGKEVYMVQFDISPDGIRQLDMTDGYSLLSGRSTFLYDLRKTMSYIFTHHKTYRSLLNEIS